MLGQRLRELREKKKMLLREVAAHLEIDTAMISKIEREEKSCKREHILKLAKLLDSSEQELMVLWLSDILFPVVKDEEYGLRALDQVKKRLKKIE